MQTGSRTTGSRPANGEPEGGRARRWAILAAVALGLFFAGRRLWPSHPPPPSQPAATEDAARGKPAAPLAALPPSRPAAKADPTSSAPASPSLPSSLRGTDEDGALRLDEHGELIVGADLLNFFDYYLSATGEESQAAIRARIVAAIRKKLTGPPADRAEKLLDQYLGFREATRSLRAGEDGDLSARFEAIKRLRREHFSAEDANKLFGEQERVDAVAVATQKIQTDPSLSPEERSRRVAELEEQLPAPVRAAKQESLRPMRQQEQEDAMRAAGATEEQIQRHRVATVGEAAAERLKTLDEERAAWKDRLRAFQAQREAIERAESNPAAREAAVQKLLEASFTPQEQLRVKAIDAIGKAAP